MTPARTSIFDKSHTLVVGVIAVHLALGLAGTALAQSADPSRDVQQPGQDQFRLRSTSEAPGASNAGAAEDAGADPLAQDAATSTSPSAATLSSLSSGIEDPNDLLDQERLQELRRQNLRENTLDGLRSSSVESRSEAPGVRVGSFVLRPALTETLGTERTRTGDDTTTRSYLRSGLKATATSDWSLHQLKIDAEGTWDKTFSGTPDDDPEGKFDAELRLDLTDEMKATLKAGYSLSREQVGDANAIAGATSQSDVEQYATSAELQRDLGVLRATAGVNFTRSVYSDAVLADGKLLDQSDRNENTAGIRGRIGYELSPALIPFIEASYSQTLYDRHEDTLGYVRNAQLYALKAGLETDFGDKLKGEIAGGYTLAEFEDARLKSISAATIDGNAIWSPRRGTNMTLNLRTEIEPSTTAGASGSTAYSGTAILSQIILENLTGQISGGMTLRDYSDTTSPRQRVVALGTGLTWGISRSLDMNADVAWEKTQQDGVDSYDVLRAGVGLTLKR